MRRTAERSPASDASVRPQDASRRSCSSAASRPSARICTAMTPVKVPRRLVVNHPELALVGARDGEHAAPVERRR